MRLDTPRARLDLRKNDVVTLRHACHSRLDVLDGVAWVTIDNDPRDVVLSRGQSFVVESGAKVLVCALRGEAVVDVLGPARAVNCPPVPPVQRPAWSGWLRGLRGAWQPEAAA